MPPSVTIEDIMFDIMSCCTCTLLIWTLNCGNLKGFCKDNSFKEPVQVSYSSLDLSSNTSSKKNICTE